MKLATIAVVGVALVATLPVSLVAASGGQEVLAGCLKQEALKEHVRELVAHDWRSLDRRWVMERWPDQLDFSAREPGSNEIVGFEQRGRVINREVQCGINYLFASRADVPPEGRKGTDSYYLRSVMLRQADRSREQAIALAHWVIEATGAPPDAKGKWSIQFDVKDPRPVVFSAEYAWPSDKYRQLLLVRVVQGREVFIVEVTWNAEVS